MKRVYTIHSTLTRQEKFHFDICIKKQWVAIELYCYKNKTVIKVLENELTGIGVMILMKYFKSGKLQSAPRNIQFLKMLGNYC